MLPLATLFLFHTFPSPSSCKERSRRPANEITFPHYRNLPFSSTSSSCSQIQYWSFCSLGKRKMWTTAAAATSGLTLLIPLALPPAGRPNDLPWPVLSGQTRELGEGERRKIYLSIALWRTLSPPPPLPAARTISFPLWAALVPSRRQRRRPRGAEPQSRLAARRAVDPDRAMGPTALPLSLSLCVGARAVVVQV